VGKKKILHVVDDEKFIDQAYFYSQITKSTIDHKFIVISESKKLKYISKTPVEILSKFLVINPFFIWRLTKYDAVIIHKLDFLKLLLIFFSSKKVNFTWIGLGVDYYRFIVDNPNDLLLTHTKELTKYDERSKIRLFLKKKFYTGFFGKKAIQKIRNFAPVLSSEFQLFRNTNNWYKGKFVNFNYGSGIGKKKNFFKNKVILGSNILIGNSATYENNHVDFFLKIKDFDLAQRKIICPLSYGRGEYRSKVIEAGVENFGKNFEELTDFIPYDEYVKKISTCSIVVMNHKRQQALGNIMLMVGMGAKVYLREENPVFSFLENLGVKLFSIEQITGELDFFTPLSIDDIGKNKNTIKNRYKEGVFEKKITQFYKDVL